MNEEKETGMKKVSKHEERKEGKGRNGREEVKEGHW